jgi:hypothetical protein
MREGGGKSKLRFVSRWECLIIFVTENLKMLGKGFNSILRLKDKLVVLITLPKRGRREMERFERRITELEAEINTLKREKQDRQTQVDTTEAESDGSEDADMEQKSSLCAYSVEAKVNLEPLEGNEEFRFSHNKSVVVSEDKVPLATKCYRGPVIAELVFIGSCKEALDGVDQNHGE